MSTGPLDPIDRPDEGVSPALVATIAGLAALLLIGIVALVLTGGDDSGTTIEVTATPFASIDGAPSPTALPTPAPSATPTSTPTPTPTPTPSEPREPTDRDVAAFAEANTPPGADNVSTVLADLDGDSRNEVVHVLRLGTTTLLQVGVWDGFAYVTGLTSEGGVAEQIVDVAVRDVNLTPRTREVVVRQRNGAEGESISVWGVAPTQDGGTVGLTELEAQGGCWDGSHTYGITGVTIDVDEARITATCDASPDPVASFPSDIYEWDDEAQAFVYVQTRGLPTETPTPTPSPTASPEASEAPTLPDLTD